jgi:hypothetical protein
MIPDGAVVSAESHLGSHLAQSETVRFFPDLRDADWILMDFWTGHYFYQTADATWAEIAVSQEWATVFAQDGLMLLTRGDGPPRKLVDAFRPSVSEPLCLIRARFGNSNASALLRGFAISARANGHVILCSDWDSSGGFLVRPEVSLDGRQFVSVDSLRFLPTSMVEPATFRDCTQLIASGWKGPPTVYYRVAGLDGRLLTAQVQDPARAESEASLGNEVIRIVID